MSFNLLKGKRGIIFGALNDASIAWKVAERAVEEGAQIVLTNTAVACRMGTIDELAKKTGATVIPADATSVEDLNNLFVQAQEALGGKIDFVLHSCAMSMNMRKKRTYDDLDYGFLDKTLDISAISFHKMLQVAKKLDALNEGASVLALTYVASHRTFFGYNDMADAKKDKLQIRNSTVDFLVFTKDAHEDGIEVRVQDHDVWLTQKAIARLFDVDRSVVTKHLKNVYESGELSEDATCANFAQVADNGKTYHYKFYSLSAIIAVGYRINSGRATQFRQWATKVLDTFTKQGYVLDKSRLINGQIFDEDYFDHLISEIQEIRASERRFYQKITDIYATAVDYSLDSQTTKDFFATVQNKMHYAVHGGTAAEVIMARADHTKEHMGLTSWKNAPDGKIVKADVSVAKNYLSMDEMQELNEIVTMYLDYATRQARRHIPMTMADWASKLDAFLQFNDAEILQNKGKVTAAIAKAFAESEFEQYRVIQDHLYQSDFDRLVASTEQKN